MTRRIVPFLRSFVALSALVLTIGAWSSPQPRNGKRAQHPQPSPLVGNNAGQPLPCGDYLAFQVLLDRQGFSPGEIDGRPGPNLNRALAAMQQARELPATAQPDCDSWHALGGDTAEPIIASYTVSPADVEGPFTKTIPSDLMAQAALPLLGYRSIAERLGERFHAAPALLVRMNKGVSFKAGTTLQVPNVQPFDAELKPSYDPAALDIAIQIARDESALRALRPDGTLAFFAPVTTGSEHDPLPTGDWKVTSIDWRPVFHYNPNLFWDAKPGHKTATIKPGPNNPVGVVWIGLTLDHYGLHGTPEPGRVGHTESHGCVRLTNWDAARVASIVKPGTDILFR